MQISLIETAPEKPVLAGQLVDLLRKSTASITDTSVEKRFQPRGMLMAQGHGYWVQFTDASLVGKPPIPGDYKLMRNAMIALDGHALVIATMQFDNPAADEPAAMLGILSSMHFRRDSAADQNASADPDAPIEFTVPDSRWRLVLALEGLERRSFHGDVKSGGSGYFIVTRINPNLNLSGWFEPASRYDGIRKLWQRDSEAMNKGGAPKPQNVTFGKEGDWETVSYALPLPGGTHCHLRAQFSSDGTWIDLHLSSVSQRTFDDALADLHAALRSIAVSVK